MSQTVGRDVLVTGGCGFVGTNLLREEALAEKSTVLDNLSRPSPTGRNGLGCHVVRGDIRFAEQIEAGLYGASSVVHLAAYGSVIESVTSPSENFDVNVRGTLNLLRAAVDSGVTRLIFASTGGALIGDAEPPVSEMSVPRPISPYGASKLCGEAYCHAFAKSYDIETICLRFGNVYGPHSAHKKGAVTTFIKSLMRDEPIVIYGDGSASRDYIHVNDLCAGIGSALDVSLSGEGVFHLASGRETTVLELAKILRDVAGKPNHPIEFKPARRGEVTRNFANYDKAREALGFEPKWQLEDGLAATWDWFVEQGEDIVKVETTDS